MANTFRMTNESGVTTSLETLYTVPSSTTTIILGIMMSNTSGGTIKASVQLVSTSAVGSGVSNSGASNANESTYLIKDAPINNSSSLEIMGGNKIVMQVGDILKAQSDTASALDIAISYMEIT
ncbi:MAG: hypothetical protein Unbinned2902contig1001_4 [Prokaryotic dsDNA virus sp.]|nr:MAG: hypothetical protein Unbinned2902contig1001_4 [Prokaryotic dsDNA virus sp.]